ncbi:GmrSD restriction endonuclease domain-containing protein [Streptomyces sp. NPDC001709]
MRRRAATLALTCLSLLVTATPAPASAAPPTTTAAPAVVRRDLPEPPATDVALKELGELTIDAPHSMAGYSRAKFPHWIKQYGECDTREVVLSRDGQDVTQDSMCRATTGRWYSPYDGKTLDAASKVDIDHMVPLANGWRSGADTWTTDKRKKFANDLDHSQLIAVSAASNRSKGDQSPDQWAPPNKDYWCTYSRAWTDIKYLYGLSITQPEKTKLTEMLNTCD